MAAGMTRRSPRIRVAAFDLDGTLLRGDTTCEVLARPLGRLARMRTLERASSRADQTAARQEMASWYRDRSTAALAESLEHACLAPGAQEGCQRLRAAGVELLIASITWMFAVEVFARQLGAAAWIGTDLTDSGTIGHVWPEDKARWLSRELARHGVAPEETAAVGDSTGDLPMLAMVGIPVFVGATLPEGVPEGTVHLPDADIRDVARLLLD
jgi:HAD superfamily phosphoserine phosphatase-like hydrolase